MGITFTIDLEDHTETYAQSDRWVRNTEHLLEFCAEEKIRATFFAVGSCAAAPALLKKIAETGHELALHSYAHTPLTREDPKIYGGKLETAKKRFEDITGKKIAGFRAPVFSLTPQSAWVLDDLARLGFIYSSSVIPGKGAFSGWPGAPKTPFRWRIPLPSGGDKGVGRKEIPGASLVSPPPAPSAFAKATADEFSEQTRRSLGEAGPEGRGEIIELPVPALRLGNAALPYLGGIYLRMLPLPLVRFLAESDLRTSEPPNPRTLLWTYTHPYDIDGEEGFVRFADGTPLWANLLLMAGRGGFLKKLAKVLEMGKAPPLIERMQQKGFAENLPVFQS